MTNQRYSLIGPTSLDSYELEDKHTGKRLILTANMIMQELLRPTPSVLLPCDNILKATPQYKQDLVYEFLRNEYSPEETIFLEDVHIPNFEYSILKRMFQQLVKKGRLFSQDRGVFTFTDACLSGEKLAYDRYIKRHGVVVGYYYGYSLAYNLGVIEEKPDKLYITTNEESQTHGRTKILKGITIRIKGSSAFVNASNVHYLELIDLLNMRFHYSWNVWKAARKLIDEYDLDYETAILFLNKPAQHLLTDLKKAFSLLSENVETDYGKKKER